MKKSIFTLLVLLIATSFVKGQDSLKVETGKIIFLRSTGLFTSASSLKTFIDGKFVCKLNDKKYSTHEVPVGKHGCSVQISGKKFKESAEKFEVEVEAGKTTYVQIIFEWGVFGNNVFCERVTENTAKQKMNKMSEDTECL